tara:strand:+ start:339 stop:1436 length:1098 start_codon:yes stop_codon:yes gene_type:complete
MNNVHDHTKNITYINFNDEDYATLSKLKCVELREIARENKIKISGKKQDIIERIRDNFIRSKCANKIQRIFRGFIARRFKQLSGPALYNRKICINDTDFVTMENILDVDWFDFFSYKDIDGTIYGFSLLSFLRYTSKHNRNVRNPYNRLPIGFNNIKNAFDLFQNNKALVGISKYNLTNVRITLPDPYNNYSISHSYYRPLLYSNISTTSRVRRLYNKMVEYRHLTLNQRIQNIFIEFDILGNYTQSVWFTSLTSHGYPKFFRLLKDIWMFRANLTRETKYKVCCLFDPFQNIISSGINLFSQTDYGDMRIISHIKLLCITAMETLIYSGIDEEHCKLGSLYCLMALTRVSHSARISMPWLYDAY